MAFASDVRIRIVPAGNLLVAMCSIKKDAFSKMGCHQLHPDRKSLIIEANRKRKGWYSSQIRWQCEDIFQVH